MKYIIKTQKGKVPKTFSDDSSYPPYLSMDYLRGDTDRILYVKPKDEYKLVDENEVLVLWDGANAGEVMFSKKGYISSTMAIVTPKSEFFEKRFLFYFLKSIEGELKKASTGTTIPHLDQNFLFNTHFEFPEVEVQKPIADYLDEQSAKITRFIQTKQRFIELLKEQRQSIITNAVTKGIDDGIKMKETVLGNIPEHWEVRRLGTIGRFSKGGNISRSELIYTDDGVPAILYGDLYTKYDIVAENIINRITKGTAAKSVELKKDDLLFTGSGETKEDIGKCVIYNSNVPAYAGGDVIIFKQDVFDSYFISYSQNSSIAKYQKAISSKGEIIVHTYGSKLRDVIMPYPPTLKEQQEIIKHIKTESRTLDIAISKAEREIELIKEYREAMIAEAVTGKMKL
ncbi:MAG TPA: restriction endonuclease subunit S [Flavipsychrobacter sp.]|nr:restriction endonuclease subunit S [Flavipsychrobacter sp.]